jgi:hypothetical protein
MGSPASLHANQLDPLLRCETKQMCPRELPAHHDLAAHVKSNQVKTRLAKINADRMDLHGDVSSVPLLYPSSPGHRRRTIPLVNSSAWSNAECDTPTVGVVRHRNNVSQRLLE